VQDLDSDGAAEREELASVHVRHAAGADPFTKAVAPANKKTCQMLSTGLGEPAPR
jgi:hypothetical protein